MEVTERRPVGSNWRRSLSTRQGTLTIAVLSALIAGGILVYALKQYRQNVNSTAKPVTVLVATELIEKGTSGDAIGVEQMFKPTRMGAKQALPGALANAASLHGEVAAADIYPGEQLTAADFAAGGLVSKLAAPQRAIAVPVDTSHGLSGDIHAGDHVDAYAFFLLKNGNAEPIPELRLLAPNVVVLKTGATSGGGLGATNQTSATSNVVLEVNTYQAAELALTADAGKVWLTLRPGRGSSPNEQLVTASSILLKNPPLPIGG